MGIPLSALPGAQEPGACDQPTAWMLGEVSRVSSKLSLSLPKPLCWDNFWCSPIVLLCPPPTTETVVPAPIPKSMLTANPFCLERFWAPAQSWGRHICEPGGMGRGSEAWDGGSSSGRVLDKATAHQLGAFWSHKWTSEPGGSVSSVLCSECYFGTTHTGIAGWRTEQVQGTCNSDLWISRVNFPSAPEWVGQRPSCLEKEYYVFYMLRPTSLQSQPLQAHWQTHSTHDCPDCEQKESKDIDAIRLSSAHLPSL